MTTYKVSNIYNQIKNNQDTLFVNVPGSKSITNRALLLALLANGKSTISGVLFSDDSRHFMNCVKDLGFETSIDEENKFVTIEGLKGKIPNANASIYVGSAGTAARFLTAVLGVSKGDFHIDASEQMKKRPMAPLLNSLSELGCGISYSEKEYHFPLTLKSNGFSTNSISINIDSSSQFLSALLIASVLSDNGFEISVEGTHGKAYVEMTRLMMEQFGVSCKDLSSKYYTAPNQAYNALNYSVEPDASAAAYFYALSPILGIKVCVPRIHFDSLQGDVQFIKVLEQMGCTAEESETGIILYPPKANSFSGIDVDMSSFSDQAITLAAIAPFANSPTTIKGIGHIRLQESDRLSAIVTELTKMNIKVEAGEDWIKVYPGMPSPAIVDTYEDHRMAMGFSLIGLRADGIEINDPYCCKKTFENYFEVLDSVINQLTL